MGYLGPPLGSWNRESASGSRVFGRSRKPTPTPRIRDRLSFSAMKDIAADQKGLVTGRFETSDARQATITKALSPRTLGTALTKECGREGT